MVDKLTLNADLYPEDKITVLLKDNGACYIGIQDAEYGTNSVHLEDEKRRMLIEALGGTIEC